MDSSAPSLGPEAAAPATTTLLGYALLHAQLAQVEWQEEKQRLLRMAAITLLGFACLLSALLFAGGLALAAAWQTDYWLASCAGLVILLAAGAAAAWRRLQTLAARGDQAFAASREELSADAVLLKRNL